MTIAIVPNVRTNWYDPQIAAGAPVVIQNVNYVTGDPNSIMNSTHRFIQDVFKRWTATAIKEGLALGGQGTGDVTVSAGYAVIQGRHIYNDASVNVSATLADDDYYIVITESEDAETQTRDPINDTVVISAISTTAYTATSAKLILGFITVVTNIATIVTSYSQAGEIRTGHIMPSQHPDGSSFSTISIWTGESVKQKTAIFTSDHFNIINNNGRIQLGASQEVYMYYSGSAGVFSNLTDGFEFNALVDFNIDFGGTFSLRDRDNSDQVMVSVTPTTVTLGTGMNLTLTDGIISGVSQLTINDPSAATSLIEGIVFPVTTDADIRLNTVDSLNKLQVFTNHANTYSFELFNNGAGVFNFNVIGDVAGTTIGGIVQANLLDKTATESLSGAWTFTSTIGFTLGTTINEFSIDGALTGDSDDTVPTEKAVKTYVDGLISEPKLYPIHSYVILGASTDYSRNYASWKLPGLDDDASIIWVFVLPSDWGDAGFTLKFVYRTSDARDVRWRASSIGDGGNLVTSDNNILDSTTDDLIDSSNNLEYQSIVISDVDVVDGDLVGVQLSAVATAPATAAQIHAIWIEKTP